MNFLSVINKCKNNNIKLAVDNGKILLKGDKERITSELINELKIYKDDIIAWLSNQSASQREDISRVSRDRALPLSFAQQRLWFIDKMDEGSARFNMLIAMRVKGAFDRAAADHAINRIIYRHESLRTVFSEQDGIPVQVIQDTFRFTLQYHDLRGDSEGQQDLRIKEFVQKESSTSFNLSADLMVRAAYLQLSDTEDGQEGVLLFNMHHIASDGWSMGLLIKEFVQHYLSSVKGEGDPLPPLNIQYADYAHWQRTWLTDDVMEKQITYWRRQLSDMPVVHGLPLDYPRPEVKTYEGGVVKGHLSSVTSSQLQALATTQQVTPFMLIHAVLALVLSRHSNSNDITIGTSAANRMQTELEPLIGFFVNTLVLRTRTDFITFSEYLAHVKQLNLDAQANQDIPFEHLIEHCHVQRNLQYTPLFQIMLSMNTNERSELSLPGLQFSQLENDDGEPANFDLEIRAEVNEDGIALWWIYDKAIFSAETIARLSLHFKCLLENIAANPNLPLRDLSMLSAAEIHHLVYELNNTEVVYPRGNRIHELFEAQVERFPNQVAVVFDDHQLTYAELNTKANQVAHYLIEEGIKTNHLVGIYALRSPDFLVGILGIMKAGGAYVPLDPTNPPERLRYMIENAQTAVVLTQSSLSGSLQAPGSCLFVDLDNSSLFGHRATNNPDVQGCEDDYAYMIYTSGSTGQPKGALVHHRGAINHIYAEFDLLGFMAEGELLPHNFLQSAASSSDVSVWQFLAPVVSGGKTVILDDMTDMAKLVRLLNNEQVHLIQTAPVVLQLLVDYLDKHGQAHGDSARALDHLRWLMIIAEPCPVPLINRWFDLYPKIPVMNGFGPTEASDDITYYIMRAALGNDVTSIPIGRAIPNMNMYVLDPQQQLVPFGSVGELCVAGVGVGPGYWQNPARNEISFVDNPYKNYPGNQGEKLYRTGDLGRWLPDGNLEFVGRIDHQVKIRGFRIELGEVEYQLSKCPGVAASTVLVREDEPGNKQLVAYVVPDEEKQINESGWVDALSSRLEINLPVYMLPSAYVVLREFPLTPADKIDKKALPAPNGIAAQPARINPETATERALVAIWAKLLKLDAGSIGVTDNFFRLGGHSILAVRLIAQVREHFGQELPVKTIFQTPHIRGLAQILVAGSTESLRTQVTPLNDRRTAPLSFAQQRLWFIDKMDGGSTQYNMPRALRIQGAFDIAAAELAIQRIIKRHQVLHTTFAEGDAGPVQVIRDNFSFTLQQQDLRGLNHEQQIHKISRLAQQDRLTPFDLTSDLMIRATYILLSDVDGIQEGVLLFNMHHIASDGWSMGVLVKEFIQQYQAALAGEPDPLPALTIQYGDYAYWQRQWLTGDILEKQLSYWRNQLADVPIVHSLPLDFPRPEMKTYEGGLVSGHITAALSQGLSALAGAQQITLFMLLHAALGMVLSRHSNTRDIVIGTPVANRLQTELEPLIGFFVNTQVLRVRTDFATLADYLAHVKQVNLDAQTYQDIPFEYLVEQCQVPRSMQHTQLFQIIFMMDTTEQSDLSLPDLRFSLLENEERAAKFDLNISANITADGIGLSWVYDKSLFREERIQQLNQHFERLLQSFIEMPDVPLRDLPMLSKEETNHLLHELNATEFVYPTGKLVHEEFEWHAESSPDNIAVIYEDQRLTYGELNEAANRLAHYLREQGVGTGSLVGIRIKRSVEMIVGIFGVLKAGGCYVPFDPDHPKARLTYVLEDTGLEHFLTQTSLSEGFELPANIKVINLDDASISQTLQNYSVTNLGRADNQDTSNLAYIIYTSGSTGKPKGVMVNHRTLSNFLHFAVRVFMPEHVEGAVVSSTLAFDATVGSLFPPFYCGRYIELLEDNENVFDGLERCLLQGHRSLLFKITPAHLNAIAGKDELIKNPNSQHVLVIAGEQLLVSNLYRWKHELLPACNFINEYGPTETTVGATTFHGIDELDIHSGSSKVVPIGRPLDNFKMYILDEFQQLLPKGAIGELYIGGAGVSVGYINRPELTEEKFVYKSFDGEDERLYRTGDLVRYLADGNIEFIGRIDHQVKIRGFRIELGEIEFQLKMCEGVATSVVIAREDEPGQKRLVAYVVPKHNESTSHAWIERIRTKLQENLPVYMVPSAIVVIDELPLNVNGKVDKNALPAPDGVLSQASYVAPETETERALVNIWAKLLQLSPEKLSVTSNFFELGGDSILSIQAVSRSAKAGMHFSVKDFFSAQTIRRLADITQSRAQVLAPQGAVTGESPLLPIQRKFFTNEVDLHHYNQATMLVTPADFEVQALVAIVKKLYEQHDVLRLKFIREEGNWRAEYVPLSDALIATSVILKEWPGDSFDELEPYVTSIQKTMQPEEGILFKAVYIRPTNPDLSGRLLLAIHHLAVDGVSWRVLLDDIENLYHQWKSGKPLNLSAKTTSFQQWGEWLSTHYAASESLFKERDYWLDFYATPVRALSELALNHSANANEKKSEGSGLATFNLSESLTKKLLFTSNHAYRTHINELLLSGLLLGVYRWSGERSLRIDLEGHGREPLTETLDISQTVGWFTSLFPLRLHIGKDETLQEIICSVKKQYRTIPVNGIGFGILKYLTQDPAFTNLPASELVFNYLGQFDQVINHDTDFSFASESSGQSISSLRKPAHPLSLNGMVVEGCLKFNLLFDQQIYAPTTMTSFMDAMSSALTDIITHCASIEHGCYTPSDFPIMNSNVTEKENNSIASKGEKSDIFPVTLAQNWLLNKDHSYRESMYKELVFNVNGIIDLEVLGKAVVTVLNHHDGLRSSFNMVNGEWRAKLSDPLSEYIIERANLSHLQTTKEIEEGCFEFFSSVRSKLDIHNGPLFSVAYVKLHEAVPDRLYFIIHHLVYDALSLEIFQEDFNAAFNAHTNSTEPFLRKSASVAEVAKWSADKEESSKIFNAVRNWLLPRTSSSLPNDFMIDSFSIDQHNLLSSATSLQTIFQLPQDGNYNIAELSKIALTNTLSNWSGNQFVELILISALRFDIAMTTGLDLSRTIGFVSGAKLHVLERMEGSAQEKIENLRMQLAELPYGGLYNRPVGEYVSNDGRRLLKEEVKINIQIKPNENNGNGDNLFEFYNDTIIPRHIDSEAQAVSSDARREELFTIDVVVSGDKLNLSWGYSRNIHTEQTIKHLLDNFEQEMRSMLLEQTLSSNAVPEFAEL